MGQASWGRAPPAPVATVAAAAATAVTPLPRYRLDTAWRPKFDVLCTALRGPPTRDVDWCEGIGGDPDPWRELWKAWRGEHTGRKNALVWFMTEMIESHVRGGHADSARSPRVHVRVPYHVLDTDPSRWNEALDDAAKTLAPVFCDVRENHQDPRLHVFVFCLENDVLIQMSVERTECVMWTMMGCSHPVNNCSDCYCNTPFPSSVKRQEYS